MFSLAWASNQPLRGVTREEIGCCFHDGCLAHSAWDDSRCPNNVAAGKLFSHDQKPGFGSPSKRSSGDEKAVDCAEFETDRSRSGEVLANLRRIHQRIDCDQ